MELVKLNDKLFGVILLLQRARDYWIAKEILLDSKSNWYEEVKAEYEKIPEYIFDEAGIAKNAHNFDTALHFVVTKEMLNCQKESLDKFTTGFWS